MQRNTTIILLFLPLLFFFLFSSIQSLQWSGDLLRYAVPTESTAGCLNFSPYVTGPNGEKFNPDYGPHPTQQTIDLLLDVIVAQTNYTCIQTYGVLYGLNYTFEAAQKRGLKVIAVIWLQPDAPQTNDESIRIGIEMAHKYSNTIIGVSCGSELRVRNAKNIATPLIIDCIQRVKEAKIPQPVTSNDYYWFWCEQQSPCQPWTEIMNLVDYVAVNVFAWWDNKHSPACAPAQVAAEVNLKMYRNAVRAYPNKLVIISEFGWPAGPKEGWEPYGYSELNDFSNERCTGYANETNQDRVIFETLNLMKQYKIPGVTFSAFRETWKDAKEGDVGAFWGFCENTYPYTCKQGIFPVENYPVRRPALPNVGDRTPIFPTFVGDTEAPPPAPTPVIFPEVGPEPTIIPPTPTPISPVATPVVPKSSSTITPKVSVPKPKTSTPVQPVPPTTTTSSASTTIFMGVFSVVVVGFFF